MASAVVSPRLIPSTATALRLRVGCLVGCWLGLAAACPGQAERGWRAPRPQAEGFTPGLLEPAADAVPPRPAPSRAEIARRSRPERSRPSRSTPRRLADTAVAAPSALLIRNPNTSRGEPPFALANQYGQVQRLVEPSHGIDLDRYVGSVVAVRHDTGRTLLASQLELNLTPTPLAEPQPAPMLSLQYDADPTARLAPVVITQFDGEPAAGRGADAPPNADAGQTPDNSIGEELLPAPIVLEEVIGDPLGGPINGPPLPPSTTLPRLKISDTPVSPPAVSLSEPHKPSACLRPGCGCSDAASPDVFFEAQLLLLRAFTDEAEAVNQDLESGSRFTLGLKSNSGGLWAARYLEYTNEQYDGNSDLSLELYDLEYGRSFQLGCRWQGLFTVGGRIAEFRETGDATYSDAIGPVVGAQLRGPRWRRLHPLLGVRHSIQFGDETGSGGGGFGTFAVTELAAGLEYQHRTSSGTTLFGRASAESILLDGPLDDDSSDGALVGFGLSLGVAR